MNKKIIICKNWQYSLLILYVLLIFFAGKQQKCVFNNVGVCIKLGNYIKNWSNINANIKNYSAEIKRVCCKNVQDSRIRV